MQQTMMIIRFLRLFECCGCAAAAEEVAAGADCVGVVDAADREDGDDDEDGEEGDAVAVCCESAELMTPIAEAAFPMKSLRGFEVEEAAWAITPATLDSANAAERRR